MKRGNFSISERIKIKLLFSNEKGEGIYPRANRFSVNRSAKPIERMHDYDDCNIQIANTTLVAARNYVAWTRSVRN